MTQPTCLQLGASRPEFLPDHALKHFLNKRWMHLGDAPDSPSKLRQWVRQRQLNKRGIRDTRRLYESTNFETWFYQKGAQLPFPDDQFDFVFSEHFFEHLFFDEALGLMKECHRVLARGGVMRVVVPDADLRTYEKPEPVGYPKPKLSYNHPNKHKTRWSVYMLTEALRICGFEPVPIHFCDRDGRFHKMPIKHSGCDNEVIRTIEYVRRPNSLIVDGLKRK